MNTDNVLKVMIELGVIGETDVTAANDLLKESAANLNQEMGGIAVTQEAVKNATEKSGNEAKVAAQKWAEHREELRQAGNELGRVTSLGNVGDRMFSKNAAPAFGAGQALEFFKETWNDIQATIKGPIHVGLPDTAPAHISAAAAAWQAYAEAKAMADISGPEADGQAQAKRLNTELGLIKQVLAAEREKATADLEQHKNSLTPEACVVAKENLDQVFTRAGTTADQDNRRKLIANKAREAANLEIEAKSKAAEAMGIKAAPAAVAAADKRKTLMEEAGTEVGQTAILRREVETDTAAETAQTAVNGRVAQLHLSASRNVQTASKETIASVQAFMSATLGGYAELRAVMNQNQRELEALRRQTQSHQSNNR